MERIRLRRFFITIPLDIHQESTKSTFTQISLAPISVRKVSILKPNFPTKLGLENKGYYIMAARRYKISLRVSKKIFTSEHSERVKYFSTREEKFRIAKRSCIVLFII